MNNSGEIDMNLDDSIDTPDSEAEINEQNVDVYVMKFKNLSHRNLCKIIDISIDS